MIQLSSIRTGSWQLLTASSGFIYIYIYALMEYFCVWSRSSCDHTVYLCVCVWTFIRYADELHRWKMCLGKHNLTFSESTEQCFNVLGIYRHEGFQYPTVPSVEFDITLLRLDGEVTANDYIDFTCLPSFEEVLPEGRNATPLAGEMKQVRLRFCVVQPLNYSDRNDSFVVVLQYCCNYAVNIYK